MVATALFLLCIAWFYFPGEYVLIASSDLGIFITTPGQLLSSLLHPGGFLEYLGNFLNQFLRFRLAGALVLSGVLTLSYLATGRLIRFVNGNNELLFAGLLTPLLLLGMHNHYPHQIYHSLGFISAIGLATIVPEKKLNRRVFLALMIPLFYQLAGGFVWIFILLLIVSDLTLKRGGLPELLLFTLLYPAVIILAAARLLYLKSITELMIHPFPFHMHYEAGPLQYLFILWILLLILLAGRSGSWRPGMRKWRLTAQIVVCISATILVLHFSYHRKNSEFFRIEKLAVQEDWQGVLDYASKHPSMNLFGSYYTNLALANTDSLCSDLFRYPQPFGRRALCFDWESRKEILRRGSDFFWTVNFTNEAQHWAYESYIIEGFTFRNLKRLIQTELVRGNDRVAGKYIRVLDHSLFGKKMATHYSRFLYNRDAVRNDPELGPRTGVSFIHDFFADGTDMEINLVSLLANNRTNRKAYDYLMALYLLEKRVDDIAANLTRYQGISQGPVPCLLDEALLLYQITHSKEDQVNIDVDPNTISRFHNYSSELQKYNDRYEAARNLYPSYGYSFWYYLNFSEQPNY